MNMSLKAAFFRRFLILFCFCFAFSISFLFFTLSLSLLGLVFFYHSFSFQAFRPATLLKETPTQVFSCEICEIFQNTFFYKTPPVAASGKWKYKSDYLPRKTIQKIVVLLQEQSLCYPFTCFFFGQNKRKITFYWKNNRKVKWENPKGGNVMFF